MKIEAKINLYTPVSFEKDTFCHYFYFARPFWPYLKKPPTDLFHIADYWLSNIFEAKNIETTSGIFLRRSNPLSEGCIVGFRYNMEQDSGSRGNKASVRFIEPGQNFAIKFKDQEEITIMNNMHCILCIVLYLLYYMHCVICIVLYALYYMHCIIWIVLYAL